MYVALSFTNNTIRSSGSCGNCNGKGWDVIRSAPLPVVVLVGLAALLAKTACVFFMDIVVVLAEVSLFDAVDVVDAVDAVDTGVLYRSMGRIWLIGVKE